MVVDREGRLEENSRGGFSTLDFYIRKRGGKGEGIWRGVERARRRSYEKLPSNLLKRHTFSCIFLKSLNLGPRHCDCHFGMAYAWALNVHKIENFFDSDFGICVISLLVMSKY